MPWIIDKLGVPIKSSVIKCHLESFTVVWINSSLDFKEYLIVLSFTILCAAKIFFVHDKNRDKIVKIENYFLDFWIRKPNIT